MIATYSYGEPRCDDALRIGVARMAPRGIRKADYRRKNYFDVWLRMLGPSQELLSGYRKGALTFREFARDYRAEMSRPEARQVIDIVALLARERPISIGCFCTQEAHCHRSLLKPLLEAAGSALPLGSPIERRPGSSPVCFAEEED